MKENFDSTTHRARPATLEEKVVSITGDIIGEKTEEEILELLAARKEALKALKQEQEAAEQVAYADNEELDALRVQLTELKASITALEQREKEIKGEEGFLSESPSAIQEKLKERGSPAEVDTAFEGGKVSVILSPEVMKSLETYDTAILAWKGASNTRTSVYDKLSEITWTPPANTALDVLILKHGETTSAERDLLVSQMDSLGYRPLSFAELVGFTTMRPDLIENRQEILITCAKYTVGGDLRVPGIDWSDEVEMRGISAYNDSSAYNVEDRFLFVPK